MGRKRAKSAAALALAIALALAAFAACGSNDAQTATTAAAQDSGAATTQAAAQDAGGAATQEAATAAPAQQADSGAGEGAGESAGAATEAAPTQPAVSPETAGDSSELPDWTGKQLTLRVWNGHGTGDTQRFKSSDDVFAPEIKRLFGITLDADNSFDNGGQDLAAKLAVLAATNDFPEIGYNVVSDDLIAGDKLYDLTELIPQYCPNIYAFMQKYSSRTLEKGYNGSGRHYTVYMNVGNDADSIRTIYPDADMDRYSNIAAPTDTLGSLTYLSVRDDVIKLMYPDAKTQKEIEDLYVKNGSFTREEVYDIPIRSRQDAIDFFYQMKQAIDENGITENGRPVYPLSVFQGQDNWALLAWLRNMMDGKSSFNYFTYFDVPTQSIQLGFKQDWFKEDVRLFNQFVRDGIAPESCLIENNEIFNSKLNNGEYATGYSYAQPDLAQQAAAGKPWAFRKVYFDIPQDTSATIPQRNEIKGWDQINIFKDMVAEEDLPQILAWLDFMYTDAGQKLAAWGPKTSGLWEESNGARAFTDKELEANLVYNVENNANVKYNLASSRYDFARPLGYPTYYIGFQGGGLFAPRYTYDLSQGERSPGGANTAFSTGMFEPQKLPKDVIVTSADIWSFTNEVESVKRFWDVRGTGFEPLLTKCLAARTDDEFESAYAAMIDFAEQNGLTDAAAKECEDLMKAKYPEDWATYLAGY
ncbi:MAG: hypothetical protein LBJ10_02175 [Clostridiales bacterium]|nr:hypothetical protein [Clostridiales bacterium]